MKNFITAMLGALVALCIFSFCSLLLLIGILGAIVSLGVKKAEPGLHEVQTWNAQNNESMLKVNAELGYLPDRDWFEYGADVAQLVQSLEAIT